MKELLAALLGSKKFWVTMAAVGAWLVGRFGFEVEPADLEPIMMALMALVVGIGLSDFGKEAALGKLKKK